MICLALAPILAVSLVTHTPSPKEVLIAKYKQFNTSYLKSDRNGIDAWVKNNCQPKFSYTSFHKTKYSLDGFRTSLTQDMQNTTRVISSTLTVRSVQAKGQQQIVIIASEFKGMVNIDSRRYSLSDQSVDTDTWVKQGKEWKLQKRVQVNADMQLQPAE